MKSNDRPDDQGNPPASPDGPLTQLVSDTDRQPEPVDTESSLPRPPEARRKPREDYAEGTPEHEDDREI